MVVVCVFGVCIQGQSIGLALTVGDCYEGGASIILNEFKLASFYEAKLLSPRMMRNE